MSVCGTRQGAEMKGHRAFTLLELLIILVVIAIIVTIALPNLLSSRIEANETATIATLNQIVKSQLDFQTRREADMNVNGIGEFGTFGEMSGNVPVRAGNGGTKFMSPEVINASFRAISPIGEMFRSGYHYRVYLPNAAGLGLIEEPGGGASVNVDADLAESVWCVYAWPGQHAGSGRRSFFTNQTGDITTTEDPTYSGPGAPIPAGAAFLPGEPASHITGTVAVNTTGRDGNTWKVATR